MSWSPCPDCVPQLVDFLHENRHVQLRIFAAGIYTFVSGYEDGLRQLRDAGAQLDIMTFKELQHCWDTFVDNHGQVLEPKTELEINIQKLKDILRVRETEG
ncbi:DNA dC-_dU-editing enzyme APOBEC-3A-like [Myotis lucifugus]|uniref:DNA dC->dU-editing enzyme APOBEC-3A-like n=1 Tax=Myotis lucifugus TaxID=59463 RepID=UPI000CCC1882|nr:DNA dC->dU-editing enzyme APOBEC-3A-like [Myotis lucifugus]